MSNAVKKLYFTIFFHFDMHFFYRNSSKTCKISTFQRFPFGHLISSSLQERLFFYLSPTQYGISFLWRGRGKHHCYKYRFYFCVSRRFLSFLSRANDKQTILKRSNYSEYECTLSNFLSNIFSCFLVGLFFWFGFFPCGLGFFSILDVRRQSNNKI